MSFLATVGIVLGALFALSLIGWGISALGSIITDHWSH